MKDDPIVAEIRGIREAHAAQFHYDLDAIFRDIKAREQGSGKTYVTFPPRRIKARAPPPVRKQSGQ
ncbi:MAG TPA: hypothetical protein VMP01_08575 [Pirellulaceae bacterium]|nr:hypothetical protein [Pirellulaceae bacterium]